LRSIGIEAGIVRDAGFLLRRASPGILESP